MLGGWGSTEGGGAVTPSLARAVSQFERDGVVHLLSAGGWGLTLPMAAAALELDKHYELTDWDNP